MRGLALGDLLDDVFQAGAFKLGAFYQIVQVGHISSVVLAVVVLQCFFGNMGSQRVHRVGQFGQCMLHISILSHFNQYENFSLGQNPTFQPL